MAVRDWQGVESRCPSAGFAISAAKVWDIVGEGIQAGCCCLPAMKAEVRSSHNDLEHRRVHWCRSELAQVHSSAPWDGSLESCQAQSGCKGVNLLTRKPWWQEELLLPRQLHNLSYGAAIQTAVTLVTTQRCYSPTAHDMQWWRVEGATTELLFPSLAGWSLSLLLCLLRSQYREGLECGNFTHARAGGFRFPGLPEHCSFSTFCPQTCLYSSFLWCFRQGGSEHCPGCPGLAVRTKRDKRKLSIGASGQRSQENKQLGKTPGFWDLFP